MRSRSKKLLLTGLATAAIAMASCGGGGGEAATGNDTTAEKPPPTKAMLIRQANQVCRKAKAGLAAKVARFERIRQAGEPEPFADMVHFIFLPTIESQVFGIEKLELPAREAQRIGDMLDAERDAIDRVAVKPRVASIAVAEKQFGKPNRLFNAYGLSACVTNGVH